MVRPNGQWLCSFGRHGVVRANNWDQYSKRWWQRPRAKFVWCGSISIKISKLLPSCEVQSVPTVYAFFNGQPVDAFTGAQPESAVTQFIDKLVAVWRGVPISPQWSKRQPCLSRHRILRRRWRKYHEIMAADPESPEGLGGMIRCFVGMRDIASARAILSISLMMDFAKNRQSKPRLRRLDLAEKAAGAADGIDAARVAVEAEPTGSTSPPRSGFGVICHWRGSGCDEPAA